MWHSLVFTISCSTSRQGHNFMFSTWPSFCSSLMALLAGMSNTDSWFSHSSRHYGCFRGKYFSENLKLFPIRQKTLPTRDRKKMAKNYIFYTFFSYVQMSKEYDYIHSIQLAFYINAVQTNFSTKSWLLKCIDSCTDI